MSDMLIFFTVVSILFIVFVTPVWFANSIEILNNSSSKLRFIPILNEIRAEVLYWGFGPVTLSWILLIVFFIGNIVFWWNSFGSAAYYIFHYGSFVALAFWYLAKSFNIWRLSRDLGLSTPVSCVLYAILYPIGYFMIQSTCKVYKSINS